MRIGKKFDELHQWHWWFAWRPVRLSNGQRAWMEGVARSARIRTAPLGPTSLLKPPRERRWDYRAWEEHVADSMLRSSESTDLRDAVTHAAAASTYQMRVQQAVDKARFVPGATGAVGALPAGAPAAPVWTDPNGRIVHGVKHRYGGP